MPNRPPSPAPRKSVGVNTPPTAPEPTVNQQQYSQVIAAAINTLRNAATRAQQLENQDPDAKVRRGEILLEMADQMQRIYQNKAGTMAIG